jgi:hypothetical protein
MGANVRDMRERVADGGQELQVKRNAIFNPLIANQKNGIHSYSRENGPIACGSRGEGAFRASFVQGKKQDIHDAVAGRQKGYGSASYY